ncbi:MAG: hypothetical protein JSR96_01085 [Proteobacteria bacterium]|nr:hypothetical protein [Pseudomonadota bacterium]
MEPKRRRLQGALTRVGWALFGAAALALSAPALGWSEQTHQTTGAIAEADLARRDPTTLAALVALARAHPDYRFFDKAAAHLSPAVRQRALFEWLGRWPDDIRTGPEDHPQWHYLLRVVHGRTWMWPFRNGQANAGFAFNHARLSDPCARPADRAKAIGWLIHIVGDVQQPLHGGHRMTATFPATDHAGQQAFVRRTATDKPTDLHQYWDKIIESGAVLPRGEPDWATAIAAAWPRQRLPELQRTGIMPDRFDSWVVESGELARLVAYRGTYLDAAPDPAGAPVVTPRENAVALALAKRRIATAGYRIADVLADAMHRAAANHRICPR